MLGRIVYSNIGSTRCIVGGPVGQSGDAGGKDSAVSDCPARGASLCVSTDGAVD
jgi:hypothetical protein